MESFLDAATSFICGFAYGTSSVIVGQPLETIKTQMQTTKQLTSVETAKAIFKQEGIRGFYRGGTPLLLGGSLIRSAQFGVNENVFNILQANETTKDYRFANVVIAGLMGGIGRGVVEGPFEYIKVRQQVHNKWRFQEVFHGYGATMFRNAFLFSSFVVYLDASNQIVPGGLPPFLSGAICSSLAWLTVWPLDVVKSRVQSGLYGGRSYWYILSDIARNHPKQLLAGLAPGLLRSSLANGTSMFMYKKVEALLLAKIEERRSSSSNSHTN